MKNIIIVNKEDLNEKKKTIAKDGADKLHILSDFDRTLTRAFVDGEKTPSIISELRKGNYISEDYAKEATALADKYHPIEVNLTIPHEKRKKARYEWWSKHFELLIRSGLNKKYLEEIIEKGKIKFRRGSPYFLDLLYEKDIPLVIISSAGLGGDSISIFLEKNRKMYNNINIISNVYEWDKNGDAIRVKKPIIHVMNKAETVLKDYPLIFNKIKNRKNVILLGDNLEDIEMIEGFDYKDLIKIGFLNENVRENLEAYKKNYDIILTNDTSMDYVNKLLKEILSKK